MGGEFRTDPDTLFHYASHTERQKEEVPRIGRALEHVEIPSGAFGKLPESDELHSSYNEHATAAQQNIHDLADLLQGVAEGLRATAGGYVQTEYAQQQTFGGHGGGAAG
ncbi:hypothetical protein [Streptomyces sp. NPDC014733]|uniref:hypothetical protein n=1 Tax=Streptomyces sp. NPDC014733 TaxID=3364885 RepID=UPI0036FDF82C